MNCEIINNRIQDEICNETIKALSDSELLEKYKEFRAQLLNQILPIDDYNYYFTYEYFATYNTK